MTFEEIEQLYNLGFSIIPIKPSDKKPYIRWKRYQFKKASLEQLKKWHEDFPNMNAGVVMKTSNLIVLDLESQEALNEIEKLGVLPKTITVESGRFKHFYFKRGDNLPPQMIKFIDDADMIVNTYVVGAGSMHFTGKKYTWIISPDECELAECPDWLKAFVKEKHLEKNAKKIERKKLNKANRAKQKALHSSVINTSMPQELTLEQKLKRALKQIKKRRPELEIHKALDTSNAKTSGLYVNAFNRIFRKRDKAVPYILWDKKNDLAKKSGKDFYITYGIILEDSKNKLRQFGEFIVNTMKKQGLEAQCSNFLSGRIRIHAAESAVTKTS